MQIVQQDQVKEVVSKLLEYPALGLDTETYGLDYNDPMFSLIIGNDIEQYYFNFNSEPDHLGTPIPALYILDTGVVMDELSPLFNSPNQLWFMHNAKFDMRRLEIAGAYLSGDIHDTEVTERIIKNNLISYSLKNVAYRYRLKKDDRVDEYIAKHKLYTMVQIPGKATKEKQKHFDKVPFDIISLYGCRDSQIVYTIGKEQRSVFGL